MIETNSYRRIHNAYRAAHEERSKALSEMIRWVFNRDRD